MATWNLGELAASTLPGYINEFKDQVFDNTVILNHMKENGGIEEKGGGRTLRVPLMNGRGNSTWFSGTDTVDIAAVDTLDAAEYTWRNLDTSITFTKDDEWANSGAEQVIDLLKAKVEQAKNTISDSLNLALFVGTGLEARARIIGLQTMGATGSYAGIDGAVYADWKAYVESTNTALTIDHIRTMRNTLNQGKGASPASIGVTTQTLYEKVESLYTPAYQMNPMVQSKETKRLADVGFTGLEYAGIPLTWDPDCPSGEFYMFNTKNVKLAVHKDANMDRTPEVMPTNQHLSVSHIVMRAVFYTNRRKSVAKLSAKTA